MKGTSWFPESFPEAETPSFLGVRINADSDAETFRGQACRLTSSSGQTSGWRKEWCRLPSL